MPSRAVLPTWTTLISRTALPVSRPFATSPVPIRTVHWLCWKARARKPSPHRCLPSSRRPLDSGCACPVAVIAATTSARWRSASRSATARFGLWDRNRICCGYLPPQVVPEHCRAQCPALFRSGGAGGIRTHDRLLTYTHFPGVRLRPLGHRSAYPVWEGAPLARLSGLRKELATRLAGALDRPPPPAHSRLCAPAFRASFAP